MPVDPLAGLFKDQMEIDRPGGAIEAHARRLAQAGLITVDECAYVRCINPLDPDRPRMPGLRCRARIYLSTDRAEDEYQCPDCGRIVYPSRKHTYASIRITPVLPAMRQYVRAQLDTLGMPVDERPAGLYRLLRDAGEVQVCLVDACRDAAVFAASYPYRDRLVYVVGNDRDYARRLPAAAATYRLAELVLAGAAARFRRSLRQLLRTQQTSAAAPPLPMHPPSVTLLPPDGASRIAPTQNARIEVPPGTTWNQIQIYLVDGETVAIRVPGRRPARYTYQALGMAHARTARPTKKWAIMEALCEGYGHMAWAGITRSFGAFKEQVSGLRTLLQNLIGISADPFRSCSQHSGLHAAFQAFPDRPDSPVVDPTAWATPVRSDRSTVRKKS